MAPKLGIYFVTANFFSLFCAQHVTLNHFVCILRNILYKIKDTYIVLWHYADITNKNTTIRHFASLFAGFDVANLNLRCGRLQVVFCT